MKFGHMLACILDPADPGTAGGAIQTPSDISPPTVPDDESGGGNSTGGQNNGGAAPITP